MQLIPVKYAFLVHAKPIPERTFAPSLLDAAIPLEMSTKASNIEKGHWDSSNSVLIIEGVKCRSPKPQVLEGGMGCRLDNDICLGIDAEFCPPSVEPPGTSCSCDESGNDCKGACGQEAFLGWCLSTEDSTKVLGKYYASSLANPCSNYTCKDGLKCIGVTGDAVCVKMKADSCKFRCGSKVDEIYTCSCESDCKTKGTCCMDYSAFCRPLKSPFTVEGFIQRLLLLWDKERMNLIYGGIGVVVFVIALCVRSCRRRSRKQSQK